MAKKKAKKKVAKKAGKKAKKTAKKSASKAGKKASNKAAASSGNQGPTVPIGGIAWSEVHVDNPGAVASYYSSLFGWKIKEMPMGPGQTYTMLSNKGVDFAGVTKKEHAEGPPMWLNYFNVASVDTLAAKGEKLGGKIIAPPMDLPGTGRMAILLDPGGAAFALFKPSPGLQM